MAGGRLPGAETRTPSRPWPYRNGYVLPSREQLEEADRTLDAMREAEIDAVRAALRVGIQWDTEVNLSGAGHLLTQVYASALPVAYSANPASLWGRLARLVLEGAYEATLRAAALNAERTGNNTVYLTLRRRGVRKRHGLDHRGFSVRPVGVFSLSPRRCRGQLPTVESTGVDADRWRLMICYTDPLVWQPLFPNQGVG